MAHASKHIKNSGSHIFFLICGALWLINTQIHIYFFLIRNVSFNSLLSTCSYLEPPEIVVFPQSTVERSIDEDVVIDCQAIGIPTPVIRWLRDELDVETIDTRYDVFLNGSWFINDTETSDSGLYICSAENEAGVFRVVVDVQITSDTCEWFTMEGLRARGISS